MGGNGNGRVWYKHIRLLRWYIISVMREQSDLLVARRAMDGEIGENKQVRT